MIETQAFKTSGKRRSLRFQGRRLQEQQVLLKHRSSPLKKGLVAKLRWKYVLAAKKSHLTLQQTLPLHKISVAPRARVNKDILQVKHLLNGLVETKEVERWLSAPNALLGGSRPIDSIKRGKTSRVVEILVWLEEGIYV